METFGHFSVLRRLGLGRTAETLLARARDAAPTTPPVVLKRALPHIAEEPSLRARFERERALSLSLQHSAIVTSFEGGERSGVPFWTMEFMEGGEITELRDQLVARYAVGEEQRARVAHPVPQVAAIGRRVAEALHYLHEQLGEAGFVHRDVRPHNILCGPRDEWKLADFGSAVDRSRVDLSCLDIPVGYDAPELGAAYHGALPAGVETGPALDIYSLGVVLGELIVAKRLQTRTPALRGQCSTQEERQRFRGRLRALQNTIGAGEAALVALLLAMTADDPCSRPRAVEVAATLRPLELVP